MNAKYNGPLHEMSQTTPTSFWNDSCSVDELNYAIERGAVGATSNPVIVLGVLKKEINRWVDFINQTINENPTWTELEVASRVYEALAINGACILTPVFERELHTRGRQSIQTNPEFYRNSQAILQQAEYYHGLAPNMQVKIPATRAGIGIVEEATYRGINLNITVSFTVPQSIAAAEAIERGLRRREAEGMDVSTMSPVVTMMIGRLDDWLKVLARKNNLEINPDYLEWPGIACFKRAYGIFMERGYRSRLLIAAFRNLLHWTEFIGGHVSLTIPHEWQVKYNESGWMVKERMQEPVKPEILDNLYEKFPDFRRAYDADGMSVDEFDHFGATVRTLRGFTEAWHSFIAMIRDFMLPNPDL